MKGSSKPLSANNFVCSSGGKGCWEVYASKNALLSMANQENASLESLIQLAENAIKLFEQNGFYLGIGINNIINCFNPAIGNRLAMAQKWIEGPIRETIQSLTLPFNQSDFKLLFSQLSIHTTALGTAAFAIENFIENDVAAL